MDSNPRLNPGGALARQRVQSLLADAVSSEKRAQVPNDREPHALSPAQIGRFMT